MTNPQSPHTNDVDKIKSSYRMMKENSKKFKDYTDNTIRKQRSAIEKLKRDNELLKEQILNQTKLPTFSRSVELGNCINKLNETVDILERKLDEEQRKVKAIEMELQKYNGEILQRRKMMGSINLARESHELIAKQIKVLENRLDNGLIKFNKALAYNKELRETIENLRQERVVFDSIYRKMEKELHEVKRKMAEVIEQSNAAYEERDQCIRDLAALKAKHEEEMNLLERQFEELNQIIKQDDELNEKIKIQGKIEREKELLSASKRLEEQAKQNALILAQQKQSQAVVHERLKKLKDLLNKIVSATGKSVEDLIKTFSENEEKNFKLFTYVNELNNEIEKLEDQIAEIGNEIKQFKGEGCDNNVKRRKILKDLEDQLSSIEKSAESFDNKYQQVVRILNAVSGAIQSIFTKIGCSPISDIGTSGVTENNILQYLGAIEQKAIEMVQKYCLQKEPKSPSTGPSLPKGRSLLKVEPPSTSDGISDDDYDDDQEERPLTREELKIKSNKSLYVMIEKKRKEPKKSKKKEVNGK